MIRVKHRTLYWRAGWKKSHKLIRKVLPCRIASRLASSPQLEGTIDTPRSEHALKISSPTIFSTLCVTVEVISGLLPLCDWTKIHIKKPACTKRAIWGCIPVENVEKYCIMGVENYHPPTERPLALAKTVEYLFLMKTIYYSTWVEGNKDKPARWWRLITTNPRLCSL